MIQLDSTLLEFIRNKQSPEVLRKYAEEAEAAKAGNPDSGRDYISSLFADPGTDANLINFDLLFRESSIRDINKAITALADLSRENDFGSEENLRKFVVLVHGIKSSLWNIGERKLSESARELEHEGRGKRLDSILALLPAFIGELEELVKKLLNGEGNSNE
jgi:HPt (histidine-containing phosphotransfer) domain-containing protein